MEECTVTPTKSLEQLFDSVFQTNSCVKFPNDISKYELVGWNHPFGYRTYPLPKEVFVNDRLYSKQVTFPGTNQTEEHSISRTGHFGMVVAYTHIPQTNCQEIEEEKPSTIVIKVYRCTTMAMHELSMDQYMLKAKTDGRWTEEQYNCVVQPLAWHVISRKRMNFPKGLHYRTMEYFETDMFDLFSQPPHRFSKNLCIDWIRQLTSCIVALHDIDIVFGDLKPENIMYDTSKGTQSIRLIDMGFAHIVGSDQSYPGDSPCFISPERAKGRYNDYVMSKPDDIWAIGLLVGNIMSWTHNYHENNTNNVKTIEQVTRFDTIKFVSRVLRSMHRYRREEFQDAAFEKHLLLFLHTCTQLDPTQRSTATQLLTMPLLSMLPK